MKAYFICFSPDKWVYLQHKTNKHDIMKRLKKKTAKVPLSEAIEMAKEKYPEQYEAVEMGGKLDVQHVDVNRLKRTAYLLSIAD